MKILQFTSYIFSIYLGLSLTIQHNQLIFVLVIVTKLKAICHFKIIS